MTTRNKILIGAGVLTLLILIVGYFFVTHKNVPTVVPNGNNTPFGNAPGNTTATGNTARRSKALNEVGNQIQTVAELREITSTPVSEAIFVPQKGNASSTAVVQFVERATGNIYEADLTSGSIIRKTNTTVAKIEHVVWGKSGVSLVAQSTDLSAITSAILTLGTTTATTTNAFTPVFQTTLPDNILSISFSPGGDKIFYILEGFAGAEGYIANGRGSNASLVWQFPTDEWISTWNLGDTVTLNSKASNGVDGFLYFLNTKTKTSTLTLSGIPGLTTLVSPSGKKVLYGNANGPSISTFLYDQNFKTRVPINLNTLPEKCVWSGDETALYCGIPRTMSTDSPDDWYQGLVSYDDDVWKFDLTSGILTKIVNLTPRANETIDIENLHLSPDGKWLVFMNKKDLSLWAAPLSSN